MLDKALLPSMKLPRLDLFANYCVASGTAGCELFVVNVIMLVIEVF